MLIVGDKLRDLAIAESDESRIDLFGRSAFNRYYYATYLITRETLGLLRKEWAPTPHKGIPSLLRTTVTRVVTKELNRQEKGGGLHGGSATMRHEATQAASDLSNLLEIAYDLRVLADYEPAQRVNRKGKSLSLGGHSVEEASRWPQRALVNTKIIIRIWKQLGLS